MEPLELLKMQCESGGRTLVFGLRRKAAKSIMLSSIKEMGQQTCDALRDPVPFA